MSQEQLIIFNRKRDRWLKDPKAFALDEPELAIAFKEATETHKAKQDLQTIQGELQAERERTRTLIVQVRELEDRLQTKTSEAFELEHRLEEAYLTREDLAEIKHLILRPKASKPKPRKQFEPGEQKALAELGWSKRARA